MLIGGRSDLLLLLMMLMPMLLRAVRGSCACVRACL